MNPLLRTLLTPFLLASVGLHAQDMIGVTFAGQVLSIDSATGASTVLASGQIGKNSLCCTTDNRLLTTVRFQTGLNFTYRLAQIDPVTGGETILFPNVDVGDLRGMAEGLLNSVFAVRNGTPSDEMVRIDLTTGAVTVIGPTGFSSIQDLTTTGAGMRAWDLNSGVLLISAETGLASDPFPLVAGPAGMQWMATNPANNVTYVGGSTMYQLNVLTGVASQPLAIQGSPDLRGVQFTTARTELIGQPCAAGLGLARIFTAGPFGNGQPLVLQGTNHTPGALCVQILGFSETVHAGQPLPIDLDPLLGTFGCSLKVSIDSTLIAIADSTGRISVTSAIPPSFDFVQFYAQHAGFEAVQGGTSWSAGLRLRPAL